ncbi:hypothetical protein DXG01_016392 [Tephrocybe rancida]|nr:hypothetical protein DXG01_016392 [Tephrocybe rancida]
MTSVETYRIARTALIKDDRSLRRDRQEHVDAEVRADQIVRDIRAAEASTIWAQEHEAIPHLFPGMEFLTGREVIMKTKLFSLLSKLALKQPALHARVTERVTNATIGSLLPTFRALPPDEFSTAHGISEESYVAGSWVSLKNARENFDPDLGGPEGFDRWVLASMMINPTEAYVTHNTIKNVSESPLHDAAVIDAFDYTDMGEVYKHLLSGLFHFAPIFIEYVREFLESSIEDGICYAEARVNFLYKYMIGADGQENIPHRDWLLMFDRVLNEVKSQLEEQGRGDELIGVRIIYATSRFITPEELEWYLEDCIALKKEFPHLIAGFDLVGNENELKPLIDYIEPLLRFKERQREQGVDIPFIFHAGETLGDGTHADDNLYDAILLDTKRIGHG